MNTAYAKTSGDKMEQIQVATKTTRHRPPPIFCRAVMLRGSGSSAVRTIPGMAVGTVTRGVVRFPLCRLLFAYHTNIQASRRRHQKKGRVCASATKGVCPSAESQETHRFVLLGIRSIILSTFGSSWPRPLLPPSQRTKSRKCCVVDISCRP